MTEASSEHLNDSGTLPQDNAQPSTSAKESFGIYVINAEDLEIEPSVTTTNINEIKVNNDNVYYTLQGVRVENPIRGVYIKGGKKVIVK